MALWDHNGQRRLMIVAIVVGGLVGLLTTLLALGYFQQKKLRQAAMEESQLARAAAARAREEANRGLRARDEAEELVGFILDDLSEELDLIGRTDLLAAAAQKAVEYFENLPPDWVTKDSKSKQAFMLYTLAQGHYVQGHHDAALAAMHRSVSLHRELASGEDPDGEFVYALGRSISELALIQDAREEYDDARASYEECLRLYANPPPSAMQDGRWDYGLATAHFGLGEVERLLGNYEKTLAAYDRAIPHLEAALRKQPDHVDWLKKRMNLQNNSGVAWMHLEDYGRAETNYLMAVETARQLVRLDPTNRRWEKELGTTLMNVGTCLDEQEDFARAEPFIREGLQVRRGLVAWDPKNARNVRSLAHAWHNLSSLQFSTGHGPEALASCRAAMTTYKRLLALDPTNRSWIEDMQQAAIKYRDRLSAAGLGAEARQLIEEAIAFAESVRAGDPQGDAWDDLLAGFYRDVRDLGGTISAETMLESARRSLTARAVSLDLQPTDPARIYGWAVGCIRLGESHQEAGLPENALTCLQLGWIVLRDRVPAGFQDREWVLEKTDRARLIAALAAQRVPAPLTLIPAGSEWRYWDRAAPPEPNWAAPDFSDQAWEKGPAPLGYGESDLATRISYGEHSSRKPITAWFRHTLILEDPGAIAQVRLSLRRDDGAVVYWNGKEILRDHLPPGDVHPETVAEMTANYEEGVYHITTLPASDLPLQHGRNVIAVEVHQNEPQSSDLALDLEILANVTEPDPKTFLTPSELSATLGDALPQSLELGTIFQ